MNNFPIPPVEPIYKSTTHLLHLVLTIATIGFWGVCVWWPLSISVNRKNNKKRMKYQQEMARYEQERFAWDQAQLQRHQPTEYFRPA